jgi:hypothetical protein
VDRAEERLLEGALDASRQARLPNRLTRPLLHLLCGADRIGHHDQPRELVDGEGFRLTRDRDNASDDRMCFPHARRRDDGDILAVRRREPVALRLVDQQGHAPSSKGATP